MERIVTCPHCGRPVTLYRNPKPTADIIIRINHGIVLINRKNPPYGWALPGGFIDYDESAEDAAVREAREETSLEITDLKQFHVYSAPGRDPRHHTITVVFTARGLGAPRAADDAAELRVFSEDTLPSPMAFDHAEILADYFASLKATGAR